MPDSWSSQRDLLSIAATATVSAAIRGVWLGSAEIILRRRLLPTAAPAGGASATALTSS